MDPFEFLTKLEELGVAFSISVPVPGGRTTFDVDPNTLIDFSEDPMAFYAEYYGVSKAVFMQCFEEAFCIYCAAFTQKGHRCKNIVNGGLDVLPEEWVHRQGELCSVHAKSSGPAKKKRVTKRSSRSQGQ